MSNTQEPNTLKSTPSRRRAAAAREIKRELAAAQSVISDRHERRGGMYANQPGALAAKAGTANAKPRGAPVRGISAGNAWQAAKRDGNGRPRATGSPYAGAADCFLTSQTHAALRNEARQSKRRFALATAIINRMADLAVGDGLIIRSASKNAEYRAKVDKILNKFFKSPTVKGRGRTWTRVCRSNVVALGTDGDIGLLWSDMGGGRSLVEEIQAERIVNPGGMWVQDTDDCIGGIDLDENGAPVAFNVQSRRDALTRYVAADTVKRSAQDMYLIINPIGEDSGQTRGVPFLTWAITLIELLETYIEDNAIAAKVATLFGLIFKMGDKQNPVSEIDVDDPNAASDPTAPPQKTQVIEPAFTATIGAGDSVEQIKPEFPHQNAKDFAKLVELLLTASVGLPLVAVLLDASDTNFHGFKSALATGYRSINNLQETAIIEPTQWVSWRLLSDAIRRGELSKQGVDDWDEVEVICPQMPIADLKTEAEAWEKLVNNNFADKDRACREMGMGDANAIAQRRGEERKLEKELDIVPVVAGATNVADANAADSAGGAGGTSNTGDAANNNSNT